MPMHGGRLFHPVTHGGVKDIPFFEPNFRPTWLIINLNQLAALRHFWPVGDIQVKLLPWEIAG